MIRRLSAAGRAWPRSAGRRVDLLHRQVEAAQRHRKRVGERRLRDDVLKIDAEVHDRLRDLRTDAADDAVGAHQPRGGDRLEQVLRDERVHRRHAGDVDDGDPATRCRRSAAAGSP